MALDGRLADLTEAEVLELLEAHPRVVNHVRSSDSRVVLMEKLYGDKEAKKALQRESKRLFPNASVPEIDIPELVKGEIAGDLKAIKELREELEGDRKSRRHASFRAKLQEDGADAEDLDAIETFMVDNEIGPKSTKLAVRQFYEAA